jgi:glycosyltransferase involved in cell wall biosynthesis
LITGTIAVCTRNRAEVLRQCLAGLDTQVADPGQIEVLVVDNGSTDDTPHLLRRWCGQGEGRRAVTHPEVGLSGARNAALAASDRDVVLFVDDDALTPPTWARAHLRAYAGDDRAGTVGGPVGLTWPAGRPGWVSDEVTMWYSALDKGDVAGPFPGDHGPYGTNMSVRRTAALDAGGYDPRLGRRGGALLSGEEPAMTRRLAAAGWSVLYAPEAAVVQQVLPERLSPRWLLRRGFAQGVSNARLAALGRQAGRREALAEAAAELRAGRDWWARRRDGGRDELAATVVALAHAGAAVDHARAAVGRQGRRP